MQGVKRLSTRADEETARRGLTRDSPKGPKNGPEKVQDTSKDEV